MSGYGLPMVALKHTGEEIVAPPVRFADVPLRTYKPGPEGEWQEVLGAVCEVSVGPYNGLVTTPVQVTVPDLRPAAVPLVLACSSGDLAGRAAIASKPGLSGPYGAVSAGMMERK